MRINSNNSIGILNQIQKTNKKAESSYSRLATGKQIVSAKDGPAQLALIERLKSSTTSLNQANKNITQARSTLNTAEGALSGVRDNLQRARELAVQASNGTLSDSDRANLETEYNQIMQEVDRTASQTSFGNTKLLDGTFNQSVQTGPDAGDEQALTTGDVSTSALGVSGTDITSQSNAQDALSAIDSALDQVNSVSANIGAQQSALEYRENANSIAAENLSAARSQAEDLDYADETAEQSRLGILQQAQLSVLKAQLGAKKTLSDSLLSNTKKF